MAKRIEHFCAFKLKDPSNPSNIKAFEKFRDRVMEIPGISSIAFGPRTLEADWEGPDKTFDYVVRVSFESLEAIHNYRPHPYHLEAIEDIGAVADQILGGYYDLT